MAQPPLQLVGIGAGDLGQMKGKGMAQIVRPQGRAPSTGIDQLGVVVAADLFEDEVDRAWRQPAIDGAGRDPVALRNQAGVCSPESLGRSCAR